MTSAKFLELSKQRYDIVTLVLFVVELLDKEGF